LSASDLDAADKYRKSVHSGINRRRKMVRHDDFGHALNGLFKQLLLWRPNSPLGHFPLALYLRVLEAANQK
jgi:hypothetical protein